MKLGQTSSQEDFKELCMALQGRLVGVSPLTMDFPGIGKKGEKITIYADRRLTADGSALLGTFYTGDGAFTTLTTYDPVAKKVKHREAQSGGAVWDIIYFKKDGKWQLEGAGSHPDGTKTEVNLTLTFSDDGETHTVSGTFTAEGDEATQSEVTYRRVGK